MYRNSRCAVKIGNCRTAFFQQGRGVRQGCSLSPTLFNIYINNLAEALDRSGSIPGLALHDSEVKCLLYVDDLVLLSPTAEGLQHSLALLEQYCEEWALTVNLDKTRVMVFQKKARSQGSRYQFSYGGEVLEHSTSYSYLGIQISASGGFSLAVKALHEKARREFYAIKSRFGQLKLPIKTWIKLYHAIIQIIILYGSGIWAPVIHLKNWEKTSLEKLQLEMIKNILGVHRSTSNDACRAELGLYPLKIEIQKRCVQFWHHLHQSDPDSVQYKALLTNETSAESHPLNTLALQLVQKTQLLTDCNFNSKIIIKEIDKNLKDTRDESLKILFDLQNKLQCYSTLNRATKFANYLLIKLF